MELREMTGMTAVRSKQGVGIVWLYGGAIALVALVLAVLMVQSSIRDTKPALKYMWVSTTTAFDCPKLWESFVVTARGNPKVESAQGLKLTKAEQRLHWTLFTFLPTSEGPATIRLSSPGYYPETLDLRVSRFTEDARLIKSETGQRIEIMRQVSLKSDSQNRLRFDNQPVSGAFPVNNFLFQAKLTGNPEDRDPPIWSCSSNMNLDKERTIGRNLLELGKQYYSQSTRISVTRIAPGPGWVRISWQGLSRTIQIPDPQPPH